MKDADASGDGETRERAGGRGAAHPAARARAKLVAASLIFLAAFGVRVLMWQDTRLEVGKVQTAVTANYRTYARHLREGGVSSFLSRDSPLADPDTLGHPPGYPVLVALVSAVFGERDAATQFAQIVCDSLAAVVLFLLVAELLSFGAGATAGALAALSPQFAWNSVLLLPDTLAVLPLLVAAYCVAVATRRARRGDGDGVGDDDSRRLSQLALLFVAGALVGVSCWLRANALLLAPFLAAVVLLLSGRAVRVRRASALLCGALVVVGALAARNAYVFRRLIPVSLGAGQTLLEGIADYDPDGRFQIPATDLGIMREEAARHGRPDYAETLFGPDAPARDRERLARGLSVVKSEPIWFAGVMARRAASMLRLERARLVSASPPVTRATDEAESRPPDLRLTPAQLLATGALNSPRAQTRLTPGDFASAMGGANDTPADSLLIDGDETRRGEQFSSAPFALRPETDYLLALPARVERGRVTLSVEPQDRGAPLSSTLADAAEVAPGDAQPERTLKLAFASRDSHSARLVLRNEDPHSSLRLGAVELRALGPSAQGWTRIPRAVVRTLQRLFLTAAVLPLACAGLFLVARSRDGGRALALLLVVPAYYMAVQSIVHTEYRYVLALAHFLFALAALALVRGASALTRRLRPH